MTYSFSADLVAVGSTLMRERSAAKVHFRGQGVVHSGPVERRVVAVAVDFTGVVPELAINVDKSAAAPLGQQIQEGLRTAIRDGRLHSDERLPSTRQLADQLGVSRGLVVAAYEQLYAEGYLVTAVGSGTRVAAGLAGAVDRGTAGATGRSANGRGGSAPGPGGEPVPDVDFGYGVPDLRSFPTRDWLWALG
jgi:GntR family transcriptional regulator/MocR family aminotransferase